MKRAPSAAAASASIMIVARARMAGGRSQRRSWISALLLLACFCAGFVPAAIATELVPDAYYWYVPEHEKYGRTELFSQPSFQSVQVRITRTQRFRFRPERRGWVLLEFDGAVKAFIHVRILRTLLWDSSAIDPWYEFKRASVFSEEPAKIEARLKHTEPAAETVDSKIPVWKRYKDGWGINKGRSPPGDAATDSTGEASRPPSKKGRNKYPLLPPIGSEPVRAEPDRASPSLDAQPGRASVPP